MVDITQNAERAQAHGLNLTGRLRHAQVKQLAEAWFPEIRFHQKERFHPIDLEKLFTAPPDDFATLPEPAKDSFRIQGSGPFGPARFDPPVITNGSQVIGTGGNGANTKEVLGNQVVGKDSVYTHGKNLRASREFFGASKTVSGAPEPAPGNPRVPRHTPIVVRAELRYLLETLKHELQQPRPDDALWGTFAVEGLFFRATQHNVVFPDNEMRATLLELINAYEDHDGTAFQDALQHDIPQGWEFVQRAWDAVTGYAFLEYSFVYAYNDYPEYGTEPFVNEHEGDIEGCCVVFERQALERFADGTDPLEMVVAHTVITSVHEESNGIDELKRLPVERDRARDDLVVWVAPGSHATYLSVGAHDILDFDDILFDWPGRFPGWAWALIGLERLLPELMALLLLAGIVEHFVDAEDETSDNGASVGPGPAPQGGTSFDKQIIVTPLSKINDPGRDLNLYQAALPHPQPSPEVTLIELARRGFPGKWGAHDGIIDHSARWENKTARYFRKFLNSGDIHSQVIL
jgi:hypothetical protein